MDFLDIKATLKDLKAVITDPNLCLVFRGFLKEILGGENLSFVVEVRKYNSYTTKLIVHLNMTLRVTHFEKNESRKSLEILFVSVCIIFRVS